MTGPKMHVSLPVRYWVIEGKIVGPEQAPGEVVRLGRRAIVARLDTALTRADERAVSPGASGAGLGVGGHLR